jgi:hypothetical protein
MDIYYIYNERYLCKRTSCCNDYWYDHLSIPKQWRVFVNRGIDPIAAVGIEKFKISEEEAFEWVMTH